MCQVAAPPAVFLAGPLQAPQSWFVITALLTGLTWVLVTAYQRHLRPLPSGAGQKVGLGLLAACGLALLAFVVIVAAVAAPALDAVPKWARAQAHSLEIHHCPQIAAAAMFAAEQHALNGIATWQRVSFVLLGVGIGAQVLYQLWVTWFTRRLRAQLARQ